MAVASPPVDVPALYEHVLKASDDADRLIASMARHGVAPDPDLLSLRAQLQQMEEQLQDVMDLLATRDALVDVGEHGAIPWSELQKQTDDGH